VIDWSPAAFLLMALSGVPAQASAADPIQFAQLVIRQQVLIRVPVRLREAPAPVADIVQWKESRGPKCLQIQSLAGATLLGPNSVDLILRDKSRIRAKMEKSCPALDFYRGFYIRQSEDGQICADRDAIRSRMGGECEIDKFRKLTAKQRD
jgi:hypothetical protein